VPIGLFLVYSKLSCNYYLLWQVDPELVKEIEQWNEALKSDVIKFCEENNFHSGFFDGNENNMVADAYELKVGPDVLVSKYIVLLLKKKYIHKLLTCRCV
jgi:hypothetical protein